MTSSTGPNPSGTRAPGSAAWVAGDARSSSDSAGSSGGDAGIDSSPTAWFARAVVAAVFALNVQSALAFIIAPGRYVGGFEVSGLPGEMLVRSLGILFLMWNATYPPVVAFPWRFRVLFAVILAQQLIGLVGETWMLLALPAGHGALASTATRFIAFDGVGLVLMALAFGALLQRGGRSDATGDAQ